MPTTFLLFLLYILPCQFRIPIFSGCCYTSLIHHILMATCQWISTFRFTFSLHAQAIGFSKFSRNFEIPAVTRRFFVFSSTSIVYRRHTTSLTTHCVPLFNKILLFLNSTSQSPYLGLHWPDFKFSRLKISIVAHNFCSFKYRLFKPNQFQHCCSISEYCITINCICLLFKQDFW